LSARETVKAFQMSMSLVDGLDLHVSSAEITPTIINAAGGLLAILMKNYIRQNPASEPYVRKYLSELLPA